MSATDMPFAGIKVLDLTHARAGPTSVRLLSDWGADTIKIEQPEATSTDKGSILGARTPTDFRGRPRTLTDPSRQPLIPSLEASFRGPFFGPRRPREDPPRRQQKAARTTKDPRPRSALWARGRPRTFAGAHGPSRTPTDPSPRPLIPSPEAHLWGSF